MNRFALALSIASLLLASCGGAQTEEASADAESSSGGEAESIAWADMNQAQRGQFMMDTVVPAMKPLFQEHDPERFAVFNCSTCHGSNGMAVGFAMPNTLAPLDPSTIGAMFESEQPMAKFMVGSVLPKMIELLDAEPLNPETGEGFACLSCHATKTD